MAGKNRVNDADVKLFWDTWESPFGTITVVGSEKGIRELQLGAGKFRADGKPSKRHAVPSVPGDANASREPGARVVRQAMAEIREYACGRRRKFSVPLDLQGTLFQRKVWKALCEIPYGETRSYQDIARSAGNPRASRAVGMANHHNPVAIVVPCHRVIASDGTLGGYAGGLELKKKILDLEGRSRRNKPE